MLEEELYEPMKGWLGQYLEDKYVGYEIIALDTHSERLDRVLARYGIVNEMAIGVDIQIDVLGIARKNNKNKVVLYRSKENQINFTRFRTTMGIL